DQGVGVAEAYGGGARGGGAAGAVLVRDGQRDGVRAAGGVGVVRVLQCTDAPVAEVPGVNEARGGVDGTRVGAAPREMYSDSRDAGVGPAGYWRGGGVVHRDRGGVVGEAAVLVLDAAPDDVTSVVVERVSGRSVGDVHQVEGAVVVEVIAVPEARAGVGGRRV